MSVKQLINKTKTRTLLLALVSVLSVFLGTDAFALASEWSSDHYNVSWDVKTGQVTIKVCYYTSYGGLGDGHSGFSPGSGYANVRFGSYDFRVECNEDGGSLKCEKQSGDGNAWYDSKYSDNGNWLVIKWNVPASMLNQETTVSIKGVWWRRGVGKSDQDVDEKYQITPTADFSKLSVSAPSFCSYNSKPAIMITWKKDGNGTDVDKIAPVHLYDNEGNDITGAAGVFASTTANDALNGTFYITSDYAGWNNNSASKYYVREAYQATGSGVIYSTQTDKVTSKAYPMMNDVKAEFDDASRKIVVKWSLANAPSVDYMTDPFVIAYTVKNANGVETSSGTREVDYQGGLTNMSEEFDVDEGKVEKWTFDIYRKSSPSTGTMSAWYNKYHVSKDLSINTFHIKAENASAKLSDDQRSAVIKWDYSGAVWSKGTKFSITRINTTYNSSEEISLSKSEFEAKEYTDDLIKVCNQYKYKLHVVPNESYGSVADAYTNVVEPIEIGKIVSIDASKGYFSDRTKIEWETKGGFDGFSVERREFGSGDNGWEQIAAPQASATSTKYSVDDDKGVAGQIYEYRVKGLLDCAGEVKVAPEQPIATGFRTPTGDLYGQISFENGQAVSGVKVLLEGKDGDAGNSLALTSGQKATINNTSLLKDKTDSVTFEAWVKPNNISSSNQVILTKPNEFTLSIDNGKINWKAGSQIATVASVSLKNNEYVHISAVKTADSLRIYVNNAEALAVKYTGGAITGNDNKIEIGGGFAGNIDEVRIWNAALDSATVVKDYCRYINGNENGLVGYYTFNYNGDGEFYDLSRVEYNYNKNHGVLEGASFSKDIPVTTQLTHMGITSNDGSYAINSIPYYGDGTSYTITPVYGIHQFSPVQETRFFNNNASNHTVNFVDKSSFPVSGRVRYKGGTVPVKDVMFSIDGVVVTERGEVVYSDAEGNFSFNVPVGIHTVQAQKYGHTFIDDGKIIDIYGNDLNYQDKVPGIELWDDTKIKFAGKVVGGTVEEDKKLGFGLTKNNLGDNVSVTLKWGGNTRLAGSPQKPLDADSTVKVAHYQLTSDIRKGTKPDTTKMVYSADGTSITIYPSKKTGEFFADVIPEKNFTVYVNVPGYLDYSNKNSGSIDFSSNVSVPQFEVYSYTDSFEVYNDKTEKKVLKTQDITDTVRYNNKFIQIVRTPTEMTVQQLNKSDMPLAYFGADTISTNNNDGTITKVPVWSKIDGYQFEDKTTGKDLAAFEQGKTSKFLIKLREAYPYYNAAGTQFDPEKTDYVAVTEENVKIKNRLAAGVQDSTLTTDSLGQAVYKWVAGDPDLTVPSQTIDITMEADGSVSQSIQGFTVGSRAQGNNFVTAGPNDVLMVLRDPPGSNSYSYLEKGTEITRSSTYTGSLENEGSDRCVLKAGINTQTISAMTLLNDDDVSNNSTVGIEHAEQYQGEDTEEISYSTTMAFSTKDDPSMVGADADVYIGNSTNLTIAATQNVALVDNASFDSQSATEYTSVISKNGQYKLVNSPGIGVTKEFGTMFAYSQIYIIETLIPKLQNLRNTLMADFPYEKYKDYTDSQLAAIANQDNTYNMIIVSKISPESEDYGRTNTKTTPKTVDNHSMMDGDSYRIFFNDNFKQQTDTISTINQWISNWEDRIRENEEQKAWVIDPANHDGSLVKNYSFEGGSPIEYSESYSTSDTHTSTFTMTIGLGVEILFGFSHNNTGYAFNIDEKVTTTQGRAESGSATAEHTKGFVLSEDVGNDLTVDVLREPIKKINNKGERYYVAWDKDSEEYEDGNMSQGMVGGGTIKEKDHYTNFIFYTKAGATSCPYEDEVRTQYYKADEGGVVISEKTIQIEQPGVIIAPKTMVNVPSGNSANFKITLYNKSGFNADLGAILKIDDESTKTGAKFYIDGAPIGNGRFFNIPAGNTIEKTLEVQRGAVMEYDDMKLILQSECDDALTDTMVFSVHFTPSCSDVRVRKPSDQWVYNTRLDTMTVDVTPEKYMNVVLDNFDVNYDRFRHIELQRKTSAESDEDWTTIMNFYANDSIMEHDRAEGKNVDMIRESDRGSIYYKMFMDDKMDQRYDLRAVSVCPINATTTATVISDVVSGNKDTYRPRLFGSAQPANGILTIEDDARLNFNEAIADGLLTIDNFQVTGIRNGSKADNTTSITLDGQDDHLATEFDKNMSYKDITMEVWAWSENGDQDATFFSHGNINESMELGITADKHLTAKVGDLKYRSDDPVPFEAGSWSHVALTYDKSGHITAYYNYEPYINANAPAYNSTGHIEVGKSISANSGNYAGRVRDFRVWNDVLSVSDFKALSEVTLSGDEPNLVGYYPMDEGKGDYTEDKARGANLTFKGGAWTTPEGISVHFDGMNDYLDLNASSFAITDEADYTAEFWFKAEPGQVNSTMFCNGAADGNDFGGSLSRVAVGFDDAGKLCFKNNGQTITVDKELRDNNWHHFAVSVSRTNNRGQIYVDGELMNYFNAQNIGGVEGSSMYLGARVWKPSVTEQIADNFFSGYIDDFRFWNLYKNKDIVSQNNNKKLEGNEIGLVHYYPFEEYQSYSGLQYLVFTNKDKHISRTVNPDTDEFAIVGTTESSLQSSDAAPIKNRGAVANLDFDFVVNNDALIINLKEDEASIAKTIVTFSVYDVRDLNGNSIASPITWSAYIDRNQLKWSETGLTLSKPVYDEMTFVVKAVNKGGAVQNFTIENLPSWLTAKPAVGTIAPASSQDIVFTVDAGLNVGTYSEVVNIMNNDGVPEALDITLTVLGEQPDWEVNKSDYEYSMNIFGQLSFNGIYSSDKRDIIAAFDAKGNCVGKANSYYDEKFDMWYALLTIYGNDSQYDGLTFRTWDASTGITYAATPSQAIRFANNEIIGDVENPVIFNGRQECYRTLNLEKGWNWISFNLASDKMNDANVLLNTGEIWSSDDILKNFDSQTSYSSKLGKWESVKLLNETSYKMKVSQAHKLTVSGSPVDVAKTKITVNGNAWNYIGYLPSVNHTVKEALAGYDAQPGDVVKSQTGFAMYSKNEWVGSLSYMNANEGYMLKRTKADTVDFVYPASSGTLGNLRAAEMLEENPERTEATGKYAENMNIVVTAEGLTADDRIVALVNGEERAVGTFVDNDGKSLSFLTVPGNEAGSSVTFARLRNSEEEISSTEVKFQSNNVVGSVESPLKLAFGNEISNDDANAVGLNSLRLYPVPFDNVLNIELTVNVGDKVSAVLSDISGRERYEVEETAAASNKFTCQIEGSGLATGVYVLSVYVNGEKRAYKVEKK